MSAKTSTGLRNHMLAVGSFANGLSSAVIKIYSTTSVPATADASIGNATLLATIYKSGTDTGLGFDTASVAGGVLAKDSSQTWSTNSSGNAASGTAAFFRLVNADDDGADSTTAKRVQGTVATAGGDLNLSSINLTAGSPQTINFFNVTLPTF